ncbi:AAA family ATPase, partial [bacterium]|nr:AAA family ATPase [bacterium]
MKLKQIRVDGYKNLINCVLNLGDFNVLVGPNNSGKSNFLEILPTLFGILCGQEALNTIREDIFGRPSTFFCNLNGYKNIGLKMQVIFDIKSRRQSWRIQYDVSITRKSLRSKKSKNKILIDAETLKGKPPNRPGPWNIFLNREPKTLRINTEATSKQHAIGNTISAFEFTRSMYPELDDLGKDFKSIVSGLLNVCHTHVLALDPGLLRSDLGKEVQLVPLIRLP